MKHYQKFALLAAVGLLSGCAALMVGYKLDAVSQGTWTKSYDESSTFGKNRVTAPCNGRILKLELVGQSRAKRYGFIIPTMDGDILPVEEGFVTRISYQDEKPMGICPMMRINNVSVIQPNQPHSDSALGNACRYTNHSLKGSDGKYLEWDKPITLDMEFLGTQDGCKLDSLKIQKIPFEKYLFIGMPRT
jgi:hypothetical protein